MASKSNDTVLKLLAVVLALPLLVLFDMCISKPPDRTPPVKQEKTLDEIFALPPEERTIEEQIRADRWAEADAELRYGIRK